MNSFGKEAHFMRGLLSFSLLVVIAFSVSGGDLEAPTSVYQALQGEWVVVGLEGEGHKATPEELHGMRWSIQGDVITVLDSDGTSGEMRFTVDPRRSPKHFDITSTDGKLKEQPDPGIYELKRDHLRICYRDPDNQTGKRPQAFTDADPVASGYGIILLKRK